MALAALRDTALFFVLTVPLTATMTMDPRGVWRVLPCALFALARGYTPAKTSSQVDVFKALKVVSSLLAVVVVNASQLGLGSSHAVVVTVLGVNMLEAALTDLSVSGLPSALCGVLLVLFLPNQPLSFLKEQGHMFLVPLTWPWVALYTTWNGAFCYGVGFAWSFRLILMTPLLVTMMLDEPEAWLGARTYSLVLVQVLRGSQFTHIFTPGRSYVTKAEGAPSTDQAWRAAWGFANLTAVAACWWAEWV